VFESDEFATCVVAHVYLLTRYGSHYEIMTDSMNCGIELLLQFIGYELRIPVTLFAIDKSADFSSSMNEIMVGRGFGVRH
jgi:hypothetical protein